MSSYLDPTVYLVVCNTEDNVYKTVRFWSMSPWCIFTF